MLCAKNDKLDPQLRSHYIRLIIVMFVDCRDNQPFLDQLPYSFVSVMKSQGRIQDLRMGTHLNSTRKMWKLMVFMTSLITVPSNAYVAILEKSGFSPFSNYM